MFAIAPLVTLALAVSASAFSITTPEKLELCQEAKYVVKDASPNDHFTAYFVHGDNPCGDEIFNLQVTNGEINWKVNATAGTSIMVALDNGSDEQWSGAVTVTGTDTSCLTSSDSAARASSSSTSSTSTRAGSAPSAPVNAASSAPSSSDVPNGSTSRAVFGITSAFALVGAAMVGVSF